MMNYLIIPMGGKGKRFLEAGYKIYKPFLPISKNLTITDNLIKNFDTNKVETIIIGNKNQIKKYKIKKIKKVKIINIENHNKGPLYSIFLAIDELKRIVKQNRLFICYSDVNWIWDFNKIKNFIKKKKSVIFTHKGFHPHLEVDHKSDFCLTNRNGTIKSISQKKTHFSDYKKESLAIGCYYFKNLNLIFNEIKNFDFFQSKKKNIEFYLVSLIRILIKKRISIFSKQINKFVHLGNPEQYQDFLSWKKIIKENLKKQPILNNFNNIMLMAGKGKRMRLLNEKKPFLKIKNSKIYDYIFQRFGAKKNIIITNSNYFNNINKSKYLVYKIDNTNSMFSTFEKSKFFISNFSKYFLTSCDCFGGIQKYKFENFLKQKNPDIVVFGYKFSNLQKNLSKSHTELILKNNSLVKINVKKNSSNSKIGHAGFFWIKNQEVFKYFNNFKIFVKKNIKNREILVDDYFSFLLRFNLMKVKYFHLDYYIHIGSPSEYNEFNYWDKYFK